MYRHIISNKSPYKKITYYTSYVDRVAHVHKNSEAYKFFTSSTYKNAIKVGKFTNVVMPIVSSILTSYVVYKRFITKTPNKYNRNYKKLELKFGSDVKSYKKLLRQMKKRGWTENSIKETVNKPYTIRKSRNLATGNSATVYYKKSGSYVIVDDVSKEIVQISDNINPRDWIPDKNIINPYKP